MVFHAPVHIVLFLCLLLLQVVATPKRYLNNKRLRNSQLILCNCKMLCCILAYSRSRVYRRFCSWQERSSNLGQDTEVRVPYCRNNVTLLHWINICWSLLDENSLVTIWRRLGNGTPLTTTSSSALLDVS